MTTTVTLLLAWLGEVIATANLRPFSSPRPRSCTLTSARYSIPSDSAGGRFEWDNDVEDEVLACAIPFGAVEMCGIDGVAIVLANDGVPSVE